MDLVTSVPKIDPEAFEEMLNSNMKVKLILSGQTLPLILPLHIINRAQYH